MGYEFRTIHIPIKCHNFKRYNQHTGSFKNLRQCGCDYYIYICLEDLSVINPYSKTYSGEKYKSFFSSTSSEDCKIKAFNFIQESIKI